MGNKLLKGTFILTIASGISKILGLLYVIPFIAMVGATGNILFEYAYKPYAIMISLSTLGIPMAISKFVSKYNERKEFDVSKRMFRSVSWVMLITGIISFLVLYMGAPAIAHWLIDESDKTGNNINDVIYVIRMVSPALIFVPIMSIIRGYFQGYGAMMPTAVSQVVEQVVRTIFILVSCYMILHVFSGQLHVAVGYATFGATAGAIIAFACLLWYLKTWQNRIHDPFEVTKPNDMKLSQMYKELLVYSIPMVLTGLSIPLYQLIETFTMNQPLMSIGYTQAQAENANSLVSMAQKLILIPVTLATTFGMTLVPAITAAYTKKDFKTLHNHVTKTFQVLAFVIMPIIVLMMVVPQSFYASMFGLTNAKEGAEILMWYTPTIMIYSVFIVTNAILQGMDKEKYVIYTMTIGVIIKLITNYVMVQMFEVGGTIITTNLGLLTSIALNVYIIQKVSRYSFGSLFSYMKSVAILSVAICVVSVSAREIIEFVAGSHMQTSYILQFVELFFVGGIGMLVYLGISFRTGTVYELLGDRYRFLKKMKKKQDKKKYQGKYAKVTSKI